MHRRLVVFINSKNSIKYRASINDFCDFKLIIEKEETMFETPFISKS